MDVVIDEENLPKDPFTEKQLVEVPGTLMLKKLKKKDNII